MKKERNSNKEKKNTVKNTKSKSDLIEIFDTIK